MSYSLNNSRKHIVLIPSEQPPHPSEIRNLSENAHWSDLAASLRPASSQPHVFRGLKKFCFNRTVSNPISHRHSTSSTNSNSQMELFGGSLTLNTDVYLEETPSQPATPHRSHSQISESFNRGSSPLDVPPRSQHLTRYSNDPLSPEILPRSQNSFGYSYVPPSSVPPRYQNSNFPSLSSMLNNNDKPISSSQKRQRKDETPKPSSKQQHPPPPKHTVTSPKRPSQSSQNVQRRSTHSNQSLSSCGVVSAVPSKFFDGLEISLGPDHIINGAISLDVLQSWVYGEDGRSQSTGIMFHIGLLWKDMSSNYEPMGIKHCTPKQDCHDWFCACRRTLRADRANSPLLGALIMRQLETSVDNTLEHEAVFLPLSACDGDLEDGEGREMGIHHSTKLPLPSNSSLSSRWNVFEMILCEQMSVMFNAHIGLMPMLALMTSQPVPRTNLFDPKVGGWLLSSSDSGDLACFDFKEQIKAHCPEYSISTSVPPQCGRAVAALWQLYHHISANAVLCRKVMIELDQHNVMAAAREIEMPLLPLLSAMEVSGVLIKPKELAKHITIIDEELRAIHQTAEQTTNHKFNISSAEQVSQLLFQHLGLKPPSGSQGKRHTSTKEEVLLELRDKHPVVDMILKHRTLSKSKNTFIDGILEFAVNTGQVCRIHAEWNQLSVETGRLSCAKPALQCLPKVAIPIADDKEELKVRNAFCASSGCTLVGVDYSQIEMRVLAHFCQDKALLQLFQDPQGDVYILVASQLLRKPPHEVNDRDRSLAKTCCLGIIYGMGVKELAKRYKVAESTAAQFMNKFSTRFPQVKLWTSRIKKEVHSNGYVTSLSGRRRQIRSVMGDNASRARAERQAVNSVIQGSASDIIKLAMVNIQQHLMQDGPSPTQRARMILQVHDELIFDVSANQQRITSLIKIIRQSMEVDVVKDLNFGVPLAVKICVGPSWGNMHPVSQALLTTSVD